MKYSDFVLHLRPGAVQPPTLSVPLRVLAVVSHFSSLTLPDVYRLQSLGAAPNVNAIFREEPAPHELRRILQEEGIQVLHFMGHGTFEAKSRQAPIEDSRWGISELVPLLREASDLRLVVLDQCGSGGDHSGEVNPFSGIATELVRSGFPAVVAMHSTTSDYAAFTFSSAFYKRLTAGDPLEAAVGAGRSAVIQQELAIGDVHSRKRDRHAELVDKKFRSMLTETEQVELLQLQTHLDEADSKLYEPIEKKLELALTKLRQRSNVR